DILLMLLIERTHALLKTRGQYFLCITHGNPARVSVFPLIARQHNSLSALLCCRGQFSGQFWSNKWMVAWQHEKSLVGVFLRQDRTNAGLHRAEHTTGISRIIYDFNLRPTGQRGLYLCRSVPQNNEYIV